MEGLYPLTTQDGRAIPLEIVKPASMIYWELVKDTEKIITIPPGFEVCFAFATTHCLLRNSAVAFAAIAEATEYTDTMLIVSDSIITLNLTPGANRRIMPLGDGIIYLSAIKQWGALVQDIQARLG